MNNLYYKYWGKARRREDEGYDYHLLPYHCLDVAAVGWFLFNPECNKCIAIANRLGLSSALVRELFTFLLVLHDIGKFSHTFQGLIPEIYMQFFEEQSAGVYTERHDSLGLGLWRGERKNDRQSISFQLSNKYPNLSPYIDLLIRSGTGHHGIPPKESAQGGGAMLRSSLYFNTNDFEAANTFVTECLKMFKPLLTELPVMEKGFKKKINEVSWQLAGLCVLSDWIGSSMDNFPYHSNPVNLKDYWENTAIPQAEKAVLKANWVPARKQPFTEIKKIFPFISTPSPLQNMAAKMKLASDPQLFIIEDVTGSGKTEAAIILAARLMSECDMDGLYFGLPTMATANAMYNRMCKAYRKLYSDTEMPSLILSHGARHLSKEFSESISIQPQKNGFQYEFEGDAGTYCNLWFADNRKKALLADIGIGTIDQALIGILPVRHQSLRLLGLKRKVLIVDEVHAYDPYTEHLLTVLLKAHAQGGGSAIILSATIPNKKRAGLINAFQSGLKGNDSFTELSDTQDFPLLTQVDSDTVIPMKVDTRNELRRNVKVNFIHSYEKFLKDITEKSNDGKCVCWVRNTVKDARRAFYDLLKSGISYDKIALFHSRFAMIDRIRIEDNAIRNFGKESGENERYGRILVATQVVEQSLDLDFDEMFTDLAPIDLLIQRAGRLHRHIRSKKGNIKTENGTDERGAPVLHIFCPEFEEDASYNWLNADFKGTAAVYQNAGVLWRTQRVLIENKGWYMPEDARLLIESVYGEGCSFDAPEGLVDNICKSDGKDKSKKSMGDLNALILEKGYCRNAVKADLWNEDDKIATRLSDENVDIVLCVVENETLVPYACTETYAWDWSSLSVSERDWRKCGYSISVEYQGMVDELKRENKRLKYCEVVIVNCRSDTALSTNEPVSDNYDPHLGWGVTIIEEV
ncbi:MAG: CRISPR-associated helicase Cas3' [Fibrobacter sp.]|nr:CRISPR-associated helicase Cas3' [Fibrobacter sp.]